MSAFSNRQNEKPTSCLPEKLPMAMFTAREVEIEKVVSFLTNEGKAIVSLHGGPGFGKTAVAVEVSHKLSEDFKIPVIFSHLSTATTVDEMILRLCRDVGVNYDEDPKSSLILWLKNIKEKVVFVMDDIDNLLELVKTHLYEFLCLLRKNSNTHCQIITTSRKSYAIPQLLTAKVQVNEMDDNACLQFLGKKCPEQDGEFLKKLADLCGKIPLAMCIASSQVDDFENPDELLQHLRNRPMETLESAENDQFVYRAINTSYEMLDDEQKESIARLAVFEGSFSEDAARAVVEKENLDAKRILKNFVSRSLITHPTKHRYSIHLLIKHFLSDKKRAERARAQTLMVGYYLDLGHDLTIKSYNKDGYKVNREALKTEAHNIQNVLEICYQHGDTTSEISNCLFGSTIYTTSVRFFSTFVRTIIPGSIVNKFLQWCAKLADERKQHAIKINFDCLLADQERTKSIATSDENFKAKMEAIMVDFKEHYEDLKEYKSICAHYYYQYGRYLLRQSEVNQGGKRFDLLQKGRLQTLFSFYLRKSLTDTSVGIADKVFSLLHLGNVWKKIAATELIQEHNLQACKESTRIALKYYEDAKDLSNNALGEHELTSACYKTLGDLFLTTKDPNKAEKNYRIAKEMRENLGLGASEKHVFLLNNIGKCFVHNNRAKEAIQLLECVCDMAEKLAESDDPTVCKAKVYTTMAIAYDLIPEHLEKAVNCAKKALELKQVNKALNLSDFGKLQQIQSRSY